MMASFQPSDEPLRGDPKHVEAGAGANQIPDDASHDELLRQVAAGMPAFFRVLKLIGKRLTAEFAPQVARIGEGQFRALAVLYEDGELQVGDLAERCGVADPTMSKMLKSLESNGLVARSTDPRNRRVVWVRLTPQGRTIFDELSAAFESSLAQLLHGLTREQLVDVLRTMRHFDALAGTDDRRADDATSSATSSATSNGTVCATQDASTAVTEDRAGIIH